LQLKISGLGAKTRKKIIFAPFINSISMTQKLISILFSIALFSSCTVLNQSYLNDPTPLGEGNGEIFLGAGTGAKPLVDSIANYGDIYFSNKIDFAPNVFLSGNYGLGERTNLRFSVHLPYLLGGFGLRAGVQQSFFKKESKFNAALGTDLGFVLAKDSLKIFGLAEELSIHANGGLNADVFLPISYTFNENLRIVLTPRLSANVLFIRYNQNEQESYKFTPILPSLALGLKTKRFYFEGNVIYFNNEYRPNFGIAYSFNINESSKDIYYED